MTENAAVNSGDTARTPGPTELNGIVVDHAQQVVDRFNQLAPDSARNREVGGEVWRVVDFGIEGSELPLVTMGVATTHGSENPDDMQAAETISWSVAVHSPHPDRVGKPHYHELPDIALSMTGSARNPNVPAAQVDNPWFGHLSPARQGVELARRTEGQVSTLQDYAATSREDALGIMREHADVGGYQVPEAATAEALGAAIAQPDGLQVRREWFNHFVAGPVGDRLALASVLELIDNAQAAQDPTSIITTAAKVQDSLTAEAREGSLSAARR